MTLTIWKADIDDSTVDNELLNHALIEGWITIVQRAKNFIVVDAADDESQWIVNCSYGLYKGV